MTSDFGMCCSARGNILGKNVYLYRSKTRQTGRRYIAFYLIIGDKIYTNTELAIALFTIIINIFLACQHGVNLLYNHKVYFRQNIKLSVT